MKKRLRWLKIPVISRSALAKVLASLRADEFTEESTAGFIVERSTKDLIEAKFIEKIVRVERYQDPFGNQTEVEKVEYNQTRFLLSTDNELLEILDSPRKLGPTLNALSIHIPSISVSPLAIDVVAWLGSIEKSIESAEVHAAMIGNVALSNHVMAKIALKGMSGVIESAKMVLKGRRYSFSMLDISGYYHGSKCKFQLFQEGRAIVSSGTDELVELLREAIPE